MNPIIKTPFNESRHNGFHYNKFRENEPCDNELSYDEPRYNIITNRHYVTNYFDGPEIHYK